MANQLDKGAEAPKAGSDTQNHVNFASVHEGGGQSFKDLSSDVERHSQNLTEKNVLPSLTIEGLQSDANKLNFEPSLKGNTDGNLDGGDTQKAPWPQAPSLKDRSDPKTGMDGGKGEKKPEGGDIHGQDFDKPVKGIPQPGTNEVIHHKPMDTAEIKGEPKEGSLTDGAIHGQDFDKPVKGIPQPGTGEVIHNKPMDTAEVKGESKDGFSIDGGIHGQDFDKPVKDRPPLAEDEILNNKPIDKTVDKDSGNIESLKYKDGTTERFDKADAAEIDKVVSKDGATEKFNSLKKISKLSETLDNLPEGAVSEIFDEAIQGITSGELDVARLQELSTAGAQQMMDLFRGQESGDPQGTADWQSVMDAQEMLANDFGIDLNITNSGVTLGEVGGSHEFLASVSIPRNGAPSSQSRFTAGFAGPITNDIETSEVMDRLRDRLYR